MGGLFAAKKVNQEVLKPVRSKALDAVGSASFIPNKTKKKARAIVKKKVNDRLSINTTSGVTSGVSKGY
jgi:hypothetical protein